MNSNDSLVDEVTHTNIQMKELLWNTRSFQLIIYLLSGSIKDEDTEKFIRDPTLNLVIIAVIKVKMVQDH